MCYILDCEDGASLYYGVKKEISREELKRRIEDHTILDVLNKVSVHKGDVFFIEAGTIHAIGAGIVICEIQQNSNTTYRVYDYDRRDASGNLRELHIDKALEVAKLSPNAQYKKGEEAIETPEYKKEWLGACKYFTSYEWNVKTEAPLPLTNDSFLSIVIVEGEGVIEKGEEKLSFKKGDSLFIPAQEGIVRIKGTCRIVTTQI